MFGHDPDEFAQTDLAHYMDRSRIALAISSCEIDDQPLLHVNDAFTKLTGHGREDVVGRNCRFLQGSKRQQDGRFRMRHFMRDRASTHLRCALVNFRADGSPFVNLIHLSQIRAKGGEQCYVFASQFDATHRHAELLEEHDAELAVAAKKISMLAREHRMMMDHSIDALAHTAASIAETKLALKVLDEIEG